MDAGDLNARLLASRASPAHGEQLDLLIELTRMYERVGVVPLDVQQLPPLHLACPCAAECWKNIGPDRLPPAGPGQFDPLSDKGCIVLPWVGPQYRRGGVCVLGMNLRYQGGAWELAVEHRIALDPSGGQEPTLRAGKRAHGSNWGTGTMRDVAAVLRALEGRTDLEAQTGADLADALLSSARIQAVKCSPVGGRSSPTPEMNQNCPPRFLMPELDILRPSVLLAYGSSTHAALARLGATVLPPEGAGVARGTLKTEGGSIELLLMTHPAHGRWHRAHRLLLESLRTRGLASPGLHASPLLEPEVGDGLEPV